MAVFEQGAVTSRSMCVCRVGAERFGLDTAAVRAVLSEQVPQRVPLAPEFVCGVLSYRGDVLPVASLGSMLAVEGSAQQGCVMVLEDETTSESFGLMVDAVEDVAWLPEASFAANPATLDARRRTLLNGVYRAECGLIGWLNARQLSPDAWQDTVAREGWNA